MGERSFEQSFNWFDDTDEGICCAVCGKRVGAYRTRTFRDAFRPWTGPLFVRGHDGCSGGHKRGGLAARPAPDQSEEP
jgi:hypothetical protein